MTIHIDGFEQFYGAPPNGALITSGYTPGVTQWAIGTGRGVASNALVGSQCALTRNAAWTGNKFSVGVAAQFTARGSLLWVKVGAEYVTLWLDSVNGLPMLDQVAGGAIPTINRWYYYELELDRALNTISLFVNGHPDCSAPLPAGFAAAGAVDVGIGYRPPADYRPGVVPVPVDLGVKTFDDLYIRDGLHIGPIIVTTRFPDFNLNTEWLNSSDVYSDAQVLSLRPPMPLDSHVASDTIGQEERFTADWVLANDNPVVATGIVVLARKSPSLDAKLGVFIGGQAGAALRQDTRTVESDWRTQYICFDAVGGDTAAGIRAAEFGINISAP